jgi:hypothetical protein
MDLAVGAKAIRVIMDHTSKKGEPRILKACTYPLTAAGCVKRQPRRDRRHAARAVGDRDDPGHDA